MKRAITGFFSGLFLLGMVSQAQAVPMTYNVTGTFNDGGALMGTIDIDNAGPPFVTDYDLMTSAGSTLGAFNYNTGNTDIIFGSQNSPNVTIVSNTPIGVGRTLNFGFLLLPDWSPDLSTPSTVYTAGVRESLINFGGINFREAASTAASTAAVPEPGTILLFGSGLLGLGLLRYRKQRNS